MVKFFFLTVLLLTISTQANAQRLDLDEDFLNTTTEDFKNVMVKNKSSLEDWIKELNEPKTQFICLGETHSEKYRNFYAQHFFTDYYLDTLFLEARQDQVDEFLKQLEVGVENIELLGADIASILRLAKRKNSNLRVLGVDVSKEQKKALVFDESDKLSREGYIAQNVMDSFVAGQKHALLIGSLHCSNSDQGLGHAIPAYRLIKNLFPGKTYSVKTVFHDPSKYFTATLMQLDFDLETMVIKNTNQIDPKNYQHVWKRKAFFENFENIIYVK